MGRVKTIARRSFLIGSAAIAGGAAFGLYTLTKPAPNPLSSTEGSIALNAFVVIEPEGITLISPKAEMGQGVHTTWAALIAEELDVEMDQITVLHGPPAKAYYNSALFGMALPFLDHEVGGAKQWLREFAGNGAKLLSLQMTGGSTSMRDGFKRMRLVGASARECLKAAAAQRLGITANNLRTEAGAVIAPDGTRIPYADLAEMAADLGPIKADLRPRSQWRLLGKTQPRTDMRAKLTGAAQYGIDLRLPGMLFASVKMSPHWGGMTRFDASAAQDMPGVSHVLDLGDGVAVVARTTWQAFQALEAIDITWDAPSGPADDAALQAQLSAGFDSPPNATPRDDGSPDAPHDGTMLEAAYSVPLLAHSTMEPMNATAHLTQGRLTLWCGNQAPVAVRDACAETAGLAPEAVEVITPLMGGGFGRRAETDVATLATRVALQLPDQPVQVTWSREEDMQHDMYRPAAQARYRGVVRDGQAVLLDGAVSGPSVMHETMRRSRGSETDMADREHVSGAFDQPYAIPHFRIRGHVVPSQVPIGYWRSVGASFNGFFFDSFIDEMAHAAGRDPLLFRRDLIRPEHAPSAQLLDTVAEMSGWGAPDRALGVAFTYSFGTPVAQVVEVIQTDDGIRISDVWIACDPGVALDPGNLEAQMTGGCLYGLSAAAMGEITLSNGAVDQLNFTDYDALRMGSAPRMQVQVLENNRHIGGAGEPGTPPAAPALANALFALTGTRARHLPLNKGFQFAL